MPAIWSPDSAPDVVVVETPVPHQAFPLPSGFVPLVEINTGQERHIVAALGTARLRLCLREAPARLIPAISIPCDSACVLRLTAAARLQRALQSGRIAADRSAFPTVNQIVRFAKLLSLHDALAAGASTRDLAFSLVFPNHRLLTGAEWKGSGEKRHVLRLLTESRKLVSGGYLRLLHRG